LNKKPNEILDPLLLMKLGLYKMTNNKTIPNTIGTKTLKCSGNLKRIEKRIINNCDAIMVKKQNVHICTLLK
jgi:hypothetical protein